MSWLKKLHIDPFLLALVCTVGTATVLPCTGTAEVFFDYLTDAAIALLFFMHGAKLSREAIIRGISNWKLHSCIFLSTFALFPLLGILLGRVPIPGLTPELYQGFLYLCVLPSTVQSSIAFTSIARGNVAAAVCSASASTILGVFISPFLAKALMAAQAGSPDIWEAIRSITLQLMLPFVLGHLLRPRIGAWMDKYRALINKTDRTSIILVVYTAFSAAVVNGIWSQVNGWSLLAICLVSMLLLAAALTINTVSARAAGFSTPDEITMVFCGSKKSLASGIPMAKVLFPSATVGIMVLPLMLFHQIQLMTCAVLASRYARRQEKEKPFLAEKMRDHPA